MNNLDQHSRVLYPIKDIKEGNRIRKDYGDLEDLAESIKTNGLIHPVVINTAGVLIAGGRRFRAHRDILKTEFVPITYFEFADEATLRILEREENIRRKPMDWTEEVISIAEVHAHHSLTAALNSEGWTQKATGELLGMSIAHISYSLQLADLVRKKDKEILACPRPWDAIQLLTKRRANESNRIVAKLTIPKLPPGSTSEASLDDIDALFAPVTPSSGGVQGIHDDGEMPGGPSNTPLITVPLSRMLLRGDAVALAEQFPAESFDHVITDWPYAIDMENLQQSGMGKDVSATAAQHDVYSNEALHTVIVPLLFRLLKPGGFFITFTDNMQWQRGYDLAIRAGFKVQRWPLIWYKTTSSNQNGAAGYNFTKNYEIAMVCRKGNATLLSPQSSSVFVGGDLTEVRALGHPFAKPYALWQWLYSAVAQRGQAVFDPFAGGGSSTIAALQYGLSPTACELTDEHHSRLVVNVSEWYKKNLANVEFI